MKNDEETKPLAADVYGENDEEQVVLTPDLLSPESSTCRPDVTPLLASTGVFEIAVETFDDNQGEFRQANFLQRICSKEGRLQVCGVFSLLVCFLIVVFSWVGTEVSAVDDATESLAVPRTPTTAHGSTFATTISVYSRLLFRYASAEDTSGPAPAVRRLTVASSVNLTLSPQDVSDSIMIQLPQATYTTLKRLQVVGMDPLCDLKGSMCLCEIGTVNISTFPAYMSHPYSACVADCSYLLEPKPQPPSDAYGASDWYQLRMPCTLQPDREYILEVLSAPDGAFQPSDPYSVYESASGSTTRRLQRDSSQDSKNETEKEESQWLESAVLGSEKRFEPSTLSSGSYTAFHRLVVTVPEGLKVLASAEEEHTVVHSDGSTEVTFKELQGWSPNMLAVAAGRFENLASGFDSDGRRVAVWALPGGFPEDAQLTLHVLNASISAWSEFTGHSIPELGKLEMVVWNGGSPWSASQVGFLFMDRFRTLWNPNFSSASDLIRAAHITCHEAGHNWFGGVLQTLNQTAFVEESTTSYGEVFCVSRVLPKALANMLTFERAFFPADGDTRSIHVGAEFHAINNLVTAEHAKDKIVSSMAYYTKGAALLHMLESYADSSVQQGLVRQVIKDLFVKFQHQAVTQDALLCLISLALGGCHPEDLTGSKNSCSVALASLIPPPPQPQEDDKDIKGTAGDSSHATTNKCAELVDRWMSRLEAWLFEPGVQQVQLHVSSTEQPGSKSTALQTYQAQLLPNSLPGQAESQTPIWLPVSLTSSSETATVVSGNSSEGLIESRWLEIFPVWEEQHRVSVDSEQLCPEKAGDDVDNTCGRPVASAPVIIDNGTTPWLMKGEPGVFLSSIADDGAGKAHKNSLVRVLRHLSLNLEDGYGLSDDDPQLKVVLAFTSLIHEQRILFRTQPTEDRYSFLRSLLAAAFQAKATSQTGVASYLLLGAATSAVQDFFQLARGNDTCIAALSDWEKDTITHRGETLWSRALSRSKHHSGFADITQDELFSQIAAAHVVPRAVRYDTELASTVCQLLPSQASSPDQLQTAYRAMPYTPDVRNMVLETAIVANSVCSDAAGLEGSVMKFLQESRNENNLMSHLQRSLVFMLGSSDNSTTLQWLVDTVVLAIDWNARYGLRAIDKYTLMKRIVRSSSVGFQVSAETLQKHAANRTADVWRDQEPLVQLAAIVSAASSESLPEWLPDSISHATLQALQIEKDSDRLGSEIVCT